MANVSAPMSTTRGELMGSDVREPGIPLTVITVHLAEGEAHYVKVVVAGVTKGLIRTED